MKWHRGLSDDWDDVDDRPPGPDVILDEDRKVVGESLAAGYVIRSGRDYVHDVTGEVVVDVGSFC